MRGAARRILRRTLPIVPRVVGALAAISVLWGRFDDLAALGWIDGVVYCGLLACVVTLGWKRTQKGTRGVAHREMDEAEFGALILLSGYTLVLPLGGVESPLYPLLYVFLASLSVFLPARVGYGLLALAAIMEAGLFLRAGTWPTFIAHLGFFAAFANLHRLLLLAQVAEGRMASRLALRNRLAEVDAAAIQYRLRIAGSTHEDVDPDRWVAGAVREVEQAIGNALEVAEHALQTHTVGVFLLTPDDQALRLADCRSLGDDVQRQLIGAREGILGAVLSRRMPTRLCGEIKGITWYEREPGIQSVVAVPLIDRRGAGRGEGFVRGVIVADRLAPTPFSDEDERLLVATSREVLRTMEIERIMGYIRQNQDEKNRIYSTIEAMNGVSVLDEVIATTIRVVNETVGAPLNLVAFTICEPLEGGELRHRIAWIGDEDDVASLGGRAKEEDPESGVEEIDISEDVAEEDGFFARRTKKEKNRISSLKDYVFSHNNGLVANVVRHRATLPGRPLRPLERPQIFDGTEKLPAVQALRIIPLKLGGEVLGTFVCGSKRRNAFDGDTVRTLEIIGLQTGQALARAQRFAETQGLATTDGLTGLINHRTFQLEFDQEISRAERSGQKVALVLLDIDHFKTINDTYGHATGDRVLRGVADIVKGTARTTDIVARYGGEEFALILPDTNMEGGKIIAERIRTVVENHEFHTELGPLRCTVSLGIASYPDVSEIKHKLFEKADQCLYHCKRMGRNRSTTVVEMSLEAQRARLRSSGGA